jgi:hypothetical protein
MRFTFQAMESRGHSFLFDIIAAIWNLQPEPIRVTPPVLSFLLRKLKTSDPLRVIPLVLSF